MTDILEQAFEAMRRLPPADQKSMANAILTVTRGTTLSLDIEPEHLSYVLEGLAQIERGEFATDKEVEDAFRSFGP